MQEPSVKLRIIFDIIALVLIFHAPWLMTCAVIAIGVFVFRNYLEVLIFGTILDVLVGFGSHNFFIYTVVLLIISVFAQRKMSLYNKIS